MTLPNISTKRRFRISLRTMLEAVFVLGVVFALVRANYRPNIKPGDMLDIRVVGTLFGQPIDGLFPVDQDGNVVLGPGYGSVSVSGLSTEEATAAIDRFLRKTLRTPEITVQRVTPDVVLQRLQAENRRLQAELTAAKPPVPIGVRRQVKGGPLIQQVPSTADDKTLLSDPPPK
jgi:hypothetical protein